MRSEVAANADFSSIRYAQVWEDADILLEGLDIRPGHVCLSIASAGDNALAMLAQGPAKVIAIDLSPAQLACLELRVAAYRELDHPELLEMIGSRPSGRRRDLYARCRPNLSDSVRAFWDRLPAEIDAGIGGAGKFERFFSFFRRRVLPCIHSAEKVQRLLEGGGPEGARRFYDREWNTFFWRFVFRLFFSRFVTGRLGRDPAFFRYAQGSVSDRFLQRARRALTEPSPAENPYMQWLLAGRHTTALPYALRPENFEAARANLGRLEMRRQSLEEFLDSADAASVDRFNLSDVFEYVSEGHYEAALEKLVRVARPRARLAYWNMLVPRRRPSSLAGRLRPLEELAGRLSAKDKGVFYDAFILEEVSAPHAQG